MNKKEEKLIEEYKKALEEEKLIEDYKWALEREKAHLEFKEYLESLTGEDKALFERLLADPNVNRFTEEDIKIWKENRKKRLTEENLKKDNPISIERFVELTIFEEYLESLTGEDKALFERLLADPNVNRFTEEELKIWKENKKKGPTEEELKNSNFTFITEQTNNSRKFTLSWDDVIRDLTNKEISSTLENTTLTDHVQDTGDEGRAITLELFNKATTNEKEDIVKAVLVHQEDRGWSKHIVYSTGFVKVFSKDNALITIYTPGQARVHQYIGKDITQWRITQTRLYYAAEKLKSEIIKKEEEIRKERNLPRRHDYTGPAREASEGENL